MKTEQRDIANLSKPEPTTADLKPKDWLPVPDIEQRDDTADYFDCVHERQDIGGNVIQDRIQANLDRYKDGPEHD